MHTAFLSRSQIDEALIPQRAPPLAAVKAEPGGSSALQKSRSDGVFGGSPRAASAASSGAASAEQLPSGKVRLASCGVCVAVVLCTREGPYTHVVG